MLIAISKDKKHNVFVCVSFQTSLGN